MFKFREVRITKKFELSGFFQFWGNDLVVLHPTEFFHCHYWKWYFFRGNFFFHVEGRSGAILLLEDPLKSEQLWGYVARERRVKRRGFLFKGLIRTQITGIWAPHTIFLPIVEILRPEHALFSSEPPSLGGSFQYWQWKNSVWVRTARSFPQNWKKRQFELFGNSDLAEFKFKMVYYISSFELELELGMRHCHCSSSHYFLVAKAIYNIVLES